MTAMEMARCTRPCDFPFRAVGILDGDDDGNMLLPPGSPFGAVGDGRRRRRQEPPAHMAPTFGAADVDGGDDAGDGAMFPSLWLSLRGRGRC